MFYDYLRDYTIIPHRHIIIISSCIIIQEITVRIMNDYYLLCNTKQHIIFRARFSLSYTPNNITFSPFRAPSCEDALILRMLMANTSFADLYCNNVDQTFCKQPVEGYTQRGNTKSKTTEDNRSSCSQYGRYRYFKKR